MKKAFLSTAFLAITILVAAQAPIVLQNGNDVMLHTKLDTIVKYANNGSTIYLPGGNVLLSASLVIDKEVHIIGAGHYPDSSAATSVTFLSGGDILFTNGSSGSTITGIYFYNNLYLARDAADMVQYINVTRCNLNVVALGFHINARNTLNSNIRFAENVFRSIMYGADAQYCLFEKNIFDERIYHLNGGTEFINNIFNYYYPTSSYEVFGDCSGLIVSNNIFTRDTHGLSSSQLNNNIFSVNIGSLPGGTNLGEGNIGNQNPSEVFVDFNGVAFSYSADLHLKEGSPGILGGTDGTHIGIYGTPNPYKPSAVPHNPHIRYINIGRESVNGFLPVEIHVGAQEN